MLEFEWDEKKNAINKEKHHISFEEAATAFTMLMLSSLLILHTLPMRSGSSCWDSAPWPGC